MGTAGNGQGGEGTYCLSLAARFSTAAALSWLMASCWRASKIALMDRSESSLREEMRWEGVFSSRSRAGCRSAFRRYLAKGGLG